jgi:conjugative transposon TraK protein
MFQQFKNIDTAFKHIRIFSIAFLAGTAILGCYLIFRTTTTLQKGQQKVYILVNGKLLDAAAIDRSDSLAVEIRDHVKMFHYYFYSLSPDDKAIKNHLTKALYLADNTAKQEFDDLSEQGYYSNIISGNINQEVADYDSILVNINQSPYYFRYFGKLNIVRPTTISIRSLVTEGYIRNTAITDNNPHGMLIERWKILENQDLSTQIRNFH